MTARDEAIQIMRRGALRYGAALDAIPADVLAQLAIERGGLVQTDWDLPLDGPPVPLYRLTNKGTPT